MKNKIHAQSPTSLSAVPVISPRGSIANAPNPIAEPEVRELAYKLYEERGRVDGYDLQDWFEAEAILREPRTIAA
jgi:hypothetical protein